MSLFVSSPIRSVAFLAAALLQGCISQDEGPASGGVCGVMQTLESEKLLTPADRDFEFSTTLEDRAFTTGLCAVHFQLSFGFENDGLQARAAAAGPYAMPLAGAGRAPDPARAFRKHHRAGFRNGALNGSRGS